MTASMAPRETWGDLEEVAIHGVLSNRRRRMTIEILREAGGSVTARDLSERIAALETGQRPPPRNARQSAYVSLLQTHLPKLDDLDIVDYDDGAKTVALGSAADQVSTFMGAESNPAPDRRYLLLSVIGLGALVVASVGLPAPVGVAAEGLLGVVLLLIAGTAFVRAKADAGLSGIPGFERSEEE